MLTIICDFNIKNVYICLQTVSGVPETVVEPVLLSQEDRLKKISAPKKKNRERGKVKLPRLSHYRQSLKIHTVNLKMLLCQFRINVLCT